MIVINMNNETVIERKLRLQRERQQKYAKRKAARQVVHYLLIKK